MCKQQPIVYLDWAATALPDEHALEAARSCALATPGNPSSAHALGRQARTALENYRARAAALTGCLPRELLFTSGGTEGNALILYSLLPKMHMEGKAPQDYSIVASAVEHDSVYQNLDRLERMGFRCTHLQTDSSGVVPPEAVKEALTPNTVLVTVMSVNNLTGAIQPLEQIAREIRSYSAAHGRRILLHTDAVQALGKGLPLPPAQNVDTAAFSAHKIGGPRGVGMLYVRSGTPLAPLVRGGEQEAGLRPGTVNLPGIAGLVAALEARSRSAANQYARVESLAARLLAGLQQIPQAVLVPPGRTVSTGSHFSPYIVGVSFPPVPAEVTVRLLGEESVFVSTGSACASRHRQKRERPYRAMGLSRELIASAIRISLGWQTTAAQIDRLLDILAARIPRMARIAGPLGAGRRGRRHGS